VKLYISDDQGDPSNALAEAKTMVETNHVIAFVGNLPVLSDFSLYPYLNQVHVPLIGGDGLYDTLVQQTPMVFPAGSPFATMTNSLATHLAGAGFKKIALFYCVEVVICSIFDQNLRSQVPAAGSTLVAEGSVSLTQPSFTSQCATAKQAGADEIIAGVEAASVIRFADSCKNSLGYTPQFSNLSIAANQEMANDPNLEGLIVPLGTFPWSDNSTPGAQLYHKLVAQYGPAIAQNASDASVWASGMLAVAASRNLGPVPTSAQFVEGLYTIKNETLGGLIPPTTFTPTARTVAPCAFLEQIIHGKFVPPNAGQCK
jgi:branched-chain amino acid transport system substrate-binding protein